MQSTPRQPVSHRWVWIGLSTLAFFVLGVFVAGYWFLVRYEDKVARHVPAGALLALRLDVEQVVLYQPIRKHVFPVLDGEKVKADRLARLKAETGVNLGMDLREILLVVLPDGQFVAAVGGLFPESELLAKVVPVLPANSGCTIQGQRLQCRLTAGIVWFEQARDGVVVASNSEQALGLALAESGEGVALGLERAPIALTVSWQRAMSKLPFDLAALGAPSWLPEVTALEAQADLSDPLQVQLVLAGVASSKVEVVRASLQHMQALTGLVRGPDLAGERDVLARASVQTTPEGRVAVASTWARNDVERAARAFADWLEQQLRR